MYQLEKIGENSFYFKVIGTFPPSIAKRFMEEFDEKIKELNNYSIIIDGLNFIFLNLESLELLMEYLKKNNEKLTKSAYIVEEKNLILGKEIEYLLDRAESPKRKIVHDFDGAKAWIGIKNIIIDKK